MKQCVASWRDLTFRRPPLRDCILTTTPKLCSGCKWRIGGCCLCFHLSKNSTWIRQQWLPRSSWLLLLSFSALHYRCRQPRRRHTIHLIRAAIMTVVIGAFRIVTTTVLNGTGDHTDIRMQDVFSLRTPSPSATVIEFHWIHRKASISKTRLLYETRPAQ